MRGRKSQIGLRLPRKDVSLLKQICEGRGENVSNFVRRAIRCEFARLSFLKPAEKKALGIKKREVTSE